MNNTKLNIVLEDNHLIVLNKYPSQIVQGDKTGDTPLTDLVKSYIKKKYNKPGDVYLGAPHRLDRPVSGIVMFCRTSKAATRMSAAFADRSICKTYWAIVCEKPDSNTGVLVNHLIKNQEQNKSRVVGNNTSNAKRAELQYKYLSSFDRYHLLEITPLTGRHHQIRVQLANIGCIIKGDLKYGASQSNKNASIHLHARSLQFNHPTTKELTTVVADPPDDPIWNHFLKQNL
jgi:23S rRNA pseudouridine1911/1915/1917 synthase